MSTLPFTCLDNYCLNVYSVKMSVTLPRRRSVRRFDSIEQEAYLALWRTYDRLRAMEDELFSRWELTAQQYNVLRLLKADHPEPVPTLGLVSRLVSRAPDVTRMLDKLEVRKLITRSRRLCSTGRIQRLRCSARATRRRRVIGAPPTRRGAATSVSRMC